jgi:TetR/AcrR family transcriptional regulator
MGASGPERRGRVHDAEGARRSILNAAEEVFAEHGFDGARIDAIAAVAGYNKSLIFQYFGDKLNLYAEVLKRADRQGTELQASLLGVLLQDENFAMDARKFKTLLEAALKLLFDYLTKYPRIVRIFAWEQAEGWQTWTKISEQFNTEDVAQFRALCSKARSAGLLRPGVDPLLLLVMAEQMYMTYLSSIPFYQGLSVDEDVSSPKVVAHIQELIVEFVVHGLMIDPIQEKKP